MENKVKNLQIHRTAQERIRKECQKLLNNFKLEKGCAHCNYKDNVFALQFDHIIPRQDTSKKWKTPENFTQVKKLIEDSNIQVLCANCHAIKTRENKDYIRRVQWQQ